MSYKIDPLDDARFDFEVGDEVIVLSTAGAKLGEGNVTSESAPGLYGVEMTTGRYAGSSKGLNGCLLRHLARQPRETPPAKTTLTIRRDQVVPGVVFQSSHGYKILVTHVIDAAVNRTDGRHVQIEGHLHANPEREITVERYPASSTIEVESFGPLPEGCETTEQREQRLAELRGAVV